MPTRAGLGRRLPALAVIGFGFAALYEASSLAFGSMREPGSGFFPTLVCILLIAFGVLTLVEPAHTRLDETHGDSSGQRRIWVVVASLAVYVFVLQPVGFVVATAALLLILLRGIGRVAWSVSAAAAVVGSVACYAGFTRLGSPLPAGVLGF